MYPDVIGIAARKAGAAGPNRNLQAPRLDRWHAGVSGVRIPSAVRVAG